MSFLADLHVHSHFSRATSPDLDLEHLARWAALKGLGVVATGDCVHPAWRGEIRDKLVADGTGLFRLRPDLAAAVAETLPPACRHQAEGGVRFVLNTEISTIYKKDGRTRKVHHLIFVPDFATMDRLAGRLGAVGNIASDGRPILGLDSRDLLEIALESGPEAFLIPAHIWTPWFSALGAQSGFDSIAACYGDLAGHIFAVETGLSSDPEMNWRVSSLDRYRLTSSSDAHSPAKLGREATCFLGAPSWQGLRAALEHGEGYGGTVEFFPEEGKYHLDGHRACHVCLDPKETLALDGRCPVCGKPLTIGVAHRVELLADRAAPAPPPTAGAVTSLVPLPEILGELHACGPASQRVGRSYDRLLAALGPELEVLTETPLEDIAALHPLLGEAVGRLRAGQVHRAAGYDGEYGTIHLFAADELATRTEGALLFDAPVRRHRRAVAAKPPAPPAPEEAPAASGPAGLDPDQAAAVAVVEGPLVVLAGPGAGKTRLLTHRIAHLVRDCGVPAAACLAVTFTRRATEELRARLAALLPGEPCAVESYHSLGLALLRAHGALLGLPAGLRVAEEGERRDALAAALGISSRQAGRLLRAVSAAKRGGPAPAGEEVAAAAALERLGRANGWVDFDDLILRAVDLLERHPEIAAKWRERFRHISADEFQDIDPAQYRLLTLLAGPAGNLCVIGDPDQAIYGFRGADAACFARFAADYPAARTLRLGRNYRSGGLIVEASAALVGRALGEGVVGEGVVAMRAPGEPVVLHAAASEAAEAGYVAATIAALMGGHDMLAASHAGARLGFADFAVLYRTDAQAAPLREALDAAGIPFKKSSPAALATHPGVAALLAALAAQPAGALAARLAAAHEAARGQEGTDPAALAEARAWLDALVDHLGEAEDEAALREQVALATEADFRDARADRVSLLTMHAAKGLEFPVVFVLGLEEGLMPFAFPGTPPDEAGRAEERRLLYVAMTRAEDRLYLLRARERFWHGERHRLAPSSFLADLPARLTRTEVAPARPRRPQQYSLF